MGSVGTVTVDVIPDATGFQRSLRGQLPLSQLDRLGSDMGRRVAKSYGQSFGRAIGGSIRGASASMANAVGGASAPVNRAAATSGTKAGRTFQTSMSKAITTGSSSSAAYANQLSGFTRGPTFGQTVARQITSGIGRYGTFTSLSGTPFQKSMQNSISGALSGATAGATRHHSNGNAGAAAAFMLPQMGTGPISGMLAMTAQTPKMLALAGGVAAVGTALMGVVQAGQAAAGGMQMYGQFAQYALTQAGELEKTSVAMNTLFGSAEAGQKMLQKSIDFAKQTPFDLPAVTDGVKQLKAYGFAAGDVIPMLRDIGDASSALGLGSYGIQRMVMAFGQIKARGTFRADEARQLTEAGIPAWRALSKALTEAEGKTVSMQEVMARAEAGQIKAGFAIRALRAEMQQTFGGSMKSQALTFLGTLERLKDSANIGLQIAMQPALKSLAATIRTVTPDIENLSYVFGSNLGAGIEGFAKTFTFGLPESLKKLGASFGPLLAKLGPRFGAIMDDIVTAFANFSPAIADVVDGFYEITKSATGMFEVISSGASALEGLTGTFKGLADAGGILPRLLQEWTNGAEVVNDAKSEAQAELTGMGRELASTIQNVNPTLPKFVPEIDIDGLQRGVPLALDKALAYLEANPAQADLLDIDPQAFRDRITEAVSDPALDGQRLTGEQEVNLDVQIAVGDAEAKLRGLAAKVANVGKYAKFGLDPGSLQDITTAMGELQKLSSLSNKDLKTVLDVNSSGVKRARAEIEGLVAYMQYSDPNLTPEVKTERIQYGMSRMTALFDQWRANTETRDVLVGLKINPQSLASFNPAAVKRLLGLDREQFIKLGVQPGQIAGFKTQLKALLAAGAGSGQYSIPVVPKITPTGGAGFWGKASALGQLAGKASTVSIPTKYKEPPPLKVKDPPPVTVNVRLDPAGLNQAKSQAAEAGKATGEQFVSNLEASKDPAAEAGAAVGEGAGTALMESSEVASSAGAAAGSGFVSGISSYTDAAYQAGVSLGEAANQGMKDTLKVNSPSKVFIGHGLSIGEGLVMGMQRSEAAAEVSAQRLAEKVTGPFGKKTERKFRKLFGKSDEWQRDARSLNKSIDISAIENVQSGDFAALDNFQTLLDKKAYRLESSAWQTEVIARKIEVLQGRVAKRQARLDREIEKGDGKPNAEQRAQQRALREKSRYLEDKQRQIGTEDWQNRKQGRLTARQQKAIDDRRRVLERVAASNEVKWEANDMLSQAKDVGASSEGINANIRDLERRLRRRQIPDAAKETVEKVLAELRELKKSVRLREIFEPIKEALDARALRDISWDGVDDWAKGIRDAIDLSEAEAPTKSAFHTLLNNRLGEIRAYASQLERIAKAKDLKQQLIDAVGGSIDWNKTTNPAGLSRSLRKRTDEMNRYANNMTALRQGGLSDKALQRIAAMDPSKAARFTQRLIQGGPGAINEFNAAIAGFNVAAESVGDRGAAAAWAETGAQAAQGFIAGMQSQESAIREALRNLAGTLVNEFKVALGIASPSKVFAEAAAWIPLGMVQGIDSERAAVQNSVRSLVSVPRMPRLQSPVGLAAGGGNQIQIDVHPREHMDERETARMVARQLAWEVL